MTNGKPTPGIFTPKIVSVIHGGYDFAQFRADAVAGLIVAIVALPLAMALAIASGASPDKGLVTAVIAGFLISALGGSRVQIGGPTGAFVVVVFNVIALHGFDGLILATMIAGLILIGAGIARLGQIVKFIPYPVVTGFTAGIAVIIATSQVKDFLGLSIPNPPVGFLSQWAVYFGAIDSVDPWTASMGIGSLALVLVLRRMTPRLPGYLITIVIASVVVAVFNLPIETIGTRFPDMSGGLPIPVWPDISIAKIQAVLPSAFTIAFLAGIEALLSCVVSDGMTGFRHRSNQELVAQGVANFGSAMFGGLPATGAIARTATNVKSGGRSPVAGIMHAIFILLFMLYAADLMRYVPMAVLAAVLFIVAWGMSESERFIALMRMPAGDRGVLLLTFTLTILVDLTVAIGVGVSLASMMFIVRMSQTTGITYGDRLLSEQNEEAEEATQRGNLPAGVEVFQITGPFFFGVAGELLDTLRRMGQIPRAIILRMRLVPYLDASGATALENFCHQARQAGCNVILSGLQPQPGEVLRRLGLTPESGFVTHAVNYAEAIRIAGENGSGKL